MKGRVKRGTDFLRSLRSSILDHIRWKLPLLLGNERRISKLREYGVRIGEHCLINTTSFSTEPYLIEIGDHVAISTGVQFITHDGAGWLFEETDPHMDVFGPIRVGNNTYFGTNCTVLPNTRIGSNCIIGSGSVVRGVIPDDSVVFGNPALVVMKTSLMKQLLVNHKHRLDTRNLPPKEKEQIVRRHFGLV